MTINMLIHQTPPGKLGDLSEADLEVLKNCRLIKGCGPEACAAVAAASMVIHVPHGVRLLDPAETSTQIYIVAEGQLGAYLDAVGQQLVTRFVPGDCLGEAALLGQHTGSLYIMPQWPARLLSIEAEALLYIMQTVPRIALNLIEVLSDRLRQSNMHRLTQQNPSEDIEFFATHDTVTGLHNKRWMLDMFEREMTRCAHSRLPISLLVVDIDHFTRINQLVGRVASDSVLRQIADMIRRIFRPSDMYARFSGDRYGVLLPGSDLHQAVQAAERFRKHIAYRSYALPGRMVSQLTVSIGVAEAATDLEATLKQADNCLKMAKLQGRNRVEPFNELEAKPLGETNSFLGDGDPTDNLS